MAKDKIVWTGEGSHKGKTWRYFRFYCSAEGFTVNRNGKKFTTDFGWLQEKIKELKIKTWQGITKILEDDYELIAIPE